MSRAEVSLACAVGLVDELVRGGARHACVSPGSRSTPLALALSRHPAITVHVHLDERSGGFFALGLAKALGEPVVLACTSGTAAAELLPAVVEASQVRAPLFVLTADRPPRLRGTGANQTIDQVELYGSYVRAYLEPPVPSSGTDVAAWSDAGASAREAGVAGDPGPVHVNCPFEEPLVGGAVAAHPPAPRSPAPRRGTDPGARPPPSGSVRKEVVARFAELHDPRGVVLMGTSERGIGAIARMASELGWPIVAEPTSGARGEEGSRPVTLSAGLHLLGDAGWLRRHRPRVVVQAGALPTSPAAQALAGGTERLIVVDDGFPDPDPDRRAAWRAPLPAEVLGDVIADAWAGRGVPDRWVRRWMDADALVRTAVDRLLDSWNEPSEMRIARDVAAAAPLAHVDPAAASDRRGTLFVGNSMPVRDLDAYMATRRGLRVLGNRGASGIDGLVSTALGVAASGTGPVVALLGDLSFLTDAGALLWNARRGIDLVIVVNDNGGGQIFAGLRQGELPAQELERLFVTPHSVDIATLCAAAGAGHRLVDRAADLIPSLAAASAAGGLQVVQVMVDAARDRIRREEVRADVADVLRRLDPG